MSQLATSPIPSTGRAQNAGTLWEMCSRQEYQSRIEANEIVKSELNERGVPDYSLAVKKYTRSAAGREILPSDVRPEPALLKTLDYLLSNIVNDTRHSFSEMSRFCSDRLRAWRSDYLYQHPHSMGMAIALEIQVRYFLLVGYLCNDQEWEEYQPDLNKKALTQSFSLLFELYQEGYVTPNYIEFYAYNHLFQPITLSSIPIVYRQNPLIQLAITTRKLIDTQNYSQLFSLIFSPSYPLLFTCLVIQENMQDLLNHAILKIYTTTRGNGKCQTPQGGEFIISTIQKSLFLSRADVIQFLLANNKHPLLHLEPLHTDLSVLTRFGYDYTRKIVAWAKQGKDYTVEGVGKYYLPPAPRARRIASVDARITHTTPLIIITHDPFGKDAVLPTMIQYINSNPAYANLPYNGYLPFDNLKKVLNIYNTIAKPLLSQSQPLTPAQKKTAPYFTAWSIKLDDVFSIGELNEDDYYPISAPNTALGDMMLLAFNLHNPDVVVHSGMRSELQHPRPGPFPSRTQTIAVQGTCFTSPNNSFSNQFSTKSAISNYTTSAKSPNTTATASSTATSTKSTTTTSLSTKSHTPSIPTHTGPSKRSTTAIAGHANANAATTTSNGYSTTTTTTTATTVTSAPNATINSRTVPILPSQSSSMGGLRTTVASISGTASSIPSTTAATTYDANAANGRYAGLEPRTSTTVSNAGRSATTTTTGLLPTNPTTTTPAAAAATTTSRYPTRGASVTSQTTPLPPPKEHTPIMISVDDLLSQYLPQTNPSIRSTIQSKLDAVPLEQKGSSQTSDAAILTNTLTSRERRKINARLAELRRQKEIKLQAKHEEEQRLASMRAAAMGEVGQLLKQKLFEVQLQRSWQVVINRLHDEMEAKREHYRTLLRPVIEQWRRVAKKRKEQRLQREADERSYNDEKGRSYQRLMRAHMLGEDSYSHLDLIYRTTHNEGHEFTDTEYSMVDDIRPYVPSHDINYITVPSPREYTPNTSKIQNVTNLNDTTHEDFQEFQSYEDYIAENSLNPLKTPPSPSQTPLPMHEEDEEVAIIHRQRQKYLYTTRQQQMILQQKERTIHTEYLCLPPPESLLSPYKLLTFLPPQHYLMNLLQFQRHNPYNSFPTVIYPISILSATYNQDILSLYISSLSHLSLEENKISQKTIQTDHQNIGLITYNSLYQYQLHKYGRSSDVSPDQSSSSNPLDIDYASYQLYLAISHSFGLENTQSTRLTSYQYSVGLSRSISSIGAPNYLNLLPFNKELDPDFTPQRDHSLYPSLPNPHTPSGSEKYMISFSHVDLPSLSLPKTHKKEEELSIIHKAYHTSLLLQYPKFPSSLLSTTSMDNQKGQNIVQTTESPPLSSLTQFLSRFPRPLHCYLVSKITSQPIQGLNILPLSISLTAEYLSKIYHALRHYTSTIRNILAQSYSPTSSPTQEEQLIFTQKELLVSVDQITAQLYAPVMGTVAEVKHSVCALANDVLKQSKDLCTFSSPISPKRLISSPKPAPCNSSDDETMYHDSGSDTDSHHTESLSNNQEINPANGDSFSPNYQHISLTSTVFQPLPRIIILASFHQIAYKWYDEYTSFLSQQNSLDSVDPPIGAILDIAQASIHRVLWTNNDLTTYRMNVQRNTIKKSSFTFNSYNEENLILNFDHRCITLCTINNDPSSPFHATNKLNNTLPFMFNNFNENMDYFNDLEHDQAVQDISSRFVTCPILIQPSFLPNDDNMIMGSNPIPVSSNVDSDQDSTFSHNTGTKDKKQGIENQPIVPLTPPPSVHVELNTTFATRIDDIDADDDHISDNTNQTHNDKNDNADTKNDNADTIQSTSLDLIHIPNEFNISTLHSSWHSNQISASADDIVQEAADALQDLLNQTQMLLHTTENTTHLNPMTGYNMSQQRCQQSHLPLPKKSSQY